MNHLNAESTFWPILDGLLSKWTNWQGLSPIITWWENKPRKVSCRSI